MNKSEYTVHGKKHQMVKCDAEARFTVKTGRRTLEDRLVPITDLGGAMIVAGFMYNGLTMSGGVAWRDPESGMPIERPTVQIRFRPQDILHNGAECDCPAHAREAA